MSPLPLHLAGVGAKILWAEEHLKSVNASVQTYLEECRQVAQFPTQINLEHGFIRIRQRALPEPDWRISLRIGDCIHNARCALDHLWKRLKPVGNFPMFSAAHGRKGWEACRSDVLSGIPEEAHAIIDTLQPCNMGDD